MVHEPASPAVRPASFARIEQVAYTGLLPAPATHITLLINRLDPSDLPALVLFS